MVTKLAKGAKLEEQTPVVLTPNETVQQQSSLEYLMAEKVRIDAELKAAKAAMPQVSKLERVIASQATKPAKWVPWVLAQKVRARTKAGQDSKVAYNEVISQYSAAVLVELQSAPTTEPEPAAE